MMRLRSRVFPTSSCKMRTPNTGVSRNITPDARLGSVYGYTYNHANRLKTVTFGGTLKGTYTYNSAHQLITRTISNSGSSNGTIHTIHDIFGNVIAEADAFGATQREYVWLPEADIGQTRTRFANGYTVC